MTTTARDLGPLGEDSFAQLCSQARITHNSSKMDRTGWDFFLELPPTLEIGDVHVAPIECKVQVKATDKKKRSVPVTLSNLQLLAEAPVPAFFAVLEFDGQDTPQRLFLVHVGEALIAQILDRIDVVEKAPNPRPLNKATMSIAYGPADQLARVDGHHLKARIEHFVPAGMSPYLVRKHTFLPTVGFEHGAAVTHLSIRGKEHLIDFVDAFIGLKDSFTADRITGHRVRFGRTAKKPLFAATEAVIQVSALRPLVQGHISFRIDRFSPLLSFPCGIYFPPPIGFSAKLFKLRVACPTFDLIISPNRDSFEFQLNHGINTLTDYDTLRNSMELFRAMQTSGKKITAEVVTDAMQPFSMTIHGLHRDFVYEAELENLRNFKRVVDYFEIDDARKTTFGEINSIAEKLREFATIIRCVGRKPSIKFDVVNGQLDTTQPAASVNCLILRLKTTALCLIFVTRGGVTQDASGRFEIVAETFDVQKFIIHDRSSEAIRDSVIELVDTTAEQYKDVCQVVGPDVGE